jgi:hypothetical protein
MRTSFRPQYGSTQSHAVTSTSSSKTINKEAKSVRIVNTGAAEAYFKIGESPQISSATAGVYLGAGQSIIVEKAVGDNTFAAYSPTTTTLIICTGEGGYN